MYVCMYVSIHVGFPGCFIEQNQLLEMLPLKRSRLFQYMSVSFMFLGRSVILLKVESLVHTYNAFPISDVSHI